MTTSGRKKTDGANLFPRDADPKLVERALEHNATHRQVASASNPGRVHYDIVNETKEIIAPRWTKVKLAQAICLDAALDAILAGDKEATNKVKLANMTFAMMKSSAQQMSGAIHPLGRNTKIEKELAEEQVNESRQAFAEMNAQFEAEMEAKLKGRDGEG